MQNLKPLSYNELPDPPRLSKLIGPSFILLGLGLGSGELILWPYLASNYGLGIIWGAVIGITLQFFLNTEIERYTLVTGESVFVGLARKLKIIAPIWFILSTFIPWIWPGIAASSAKLLATVLGIEYSSYLGIIMLILMGIILSLGPILYKTQEKFQKLIIFLGIPFIFIVTFLLARRSDWTFLAQGIIGRGDVYWFLPAGISISTFLGALAYAGAGGNLNLSQSLYIKEKGYGMGKYSGRITGLLRNNKEDIRLEGTTFELNEDNTNKFRKWWKSINIEHSLLFWATGLLTMLMLSLLSYTTAFGKEGMQNGINFVIQESFGIGQRTFPFIGTLFLIVASIMLFGTQFSVFGSTSRIMSENLVIADRKSFSISNLPKYFYFFLWLQIIGGVLILLLGFTEPLQLVIIGAVLNAITMFIYSALVLWLNISSLPKPLRPGILRIIALVSSVFFYGGFSVYTIFSFIQS